MGGFLDILILLTFLLEVLVLFYFEMKAWRTLYTPLNILMLPYVIVLLISVAISGKFGFVELYYPSILLWSVGLFIFALPSYAFAYAMQQSKHTLNSPLKESAMPRLAIYLSFIVILLFVWRFKAVIGAFPIGSREFGDAFCGDGFWGHLRQLSLPIWMMAIYYVDKQRKWLWLIILPLFLVAVLYQILGWVIIPALAAIMLRLYTGKTKLRLSLLLYVVLGAALVFLGSYLISLVLVQDKDFNNEVLSFIFRHFFHYLTSGTLGFSVDAELGFPDRGEFDMVITQLVNLGNVLIGNDEVVSPLNPYYIHTGINYTNVRTLFGTVFINTNIPTFIVFFLFLSSMAYSLKLATIRYNNIFVYIAYFFECGLLFMGWFDSYFAGLSVIEIPILSFVLWFACKTFEPKILHTTA